MSSSDFVSQSISLTSPVRSGSISCGESIWSPMISRPFAYSLLKLVLSCPVVRKSESMMMMPLPLIW